MLKDNSVTLEKEDEFREHLSKKYKPLSVRNIIGNAKYLLRNGALFMKEAQFEDWIWHASLSTASRGHYRNAYRQYNSWRQMA